jgi:hypothetical protein
MNDAWGNRICMQISCWKTLGGLCHLRGLHVTDKILSSILEKLNVKVWTEFNLTQGGVP